MKFVPLIFTTTLLLSACGGGGSSSTPTDSSNDTDSANGSITIIGTAAVGATLTALVSDDDGFESVSYQWQSDDSDINGATASTFDITAAYTDLQISVRADYTDNTGVKEALVSEYTDPISNTNNPGRLSISGSTEVGSTLSALLEDDDGFDNVTYQWYANATAIADATGETLILTANQLETRITVRALYTDEADYKEALISAATETVSETSPNGSITIDGIFRSGEIITASITDPQEVGNPAFTWFLEGLAIENETQAELLLNESHVGKVIQVQAQYRDSSGTQERPTSQPTPVITLQNISGELSIDGEALVGSTLTAVIADANGVGTTSYQWYLGDELIAGAATNTLVVLLAHVGQPISVSAQYRDGGGYDESLESSATEVVSVENIEGIASIGGEVSVGNQIRALVSDGNGISDVDYQWFLDDETITDAVNSTYTIAANDAGKTLYFTASYIDHAGFEEHHTSNTVSVPFVNFPGELSVSGTARVGETLTVTLSDDNGVGNVEYQWYDEGVAIDDALSSSYTLRPSNAEHVIQVRATYTDLQGFAEQVTIIAADSVEQINYPGVLTISGEYIVGGELSLNLEDDNGIDDVTYQWFANDEVIEGIEGRVYTLQESEKGALIRVSADYIDADGFTESVSAQSDEFVAPVNYPGSITLSGTTQSGRTLTALVSDENGTEEIDYQWMADDEAITGATTSDYLLTDNEIGKTITVSATYTDNDNFLEDVTSPESSIVEAAPVNIPGVLTIIGNAEIGATLQTSLTDDNGISGDIIYQWRADDEDIVGATNTSLFLESDFRGSIVTVIAQYHDDDEFEETATASTVDPVAVINVQGSVTVNGSARSQETLTANVSDLNGINEISYAWLANGETIDDALSQSLVLQDAQIGSVITVQVSYTDNDGFDESLVSEASEVVRPVAVNSIGDVSITGDPVIGASLIATVSDGNGISTSITYQWQAEGIDIPGETSHTLVLSDEQLGKVVSLNAIYQDDDFFDESLTQQFGVIVTSLASNGPELTIAVLGAQAGDWIGLNGGATDYVDLNISINQAITLTNTTGSSAEISGATCLVIDDSNDDGAMLTGLTFSSLGLQSGSECALNENASILLSGDNVVFKQNQLLSQQEGSALEHNWLVVHGSGSLVERNLFINKPVSSPGAFISLASLDLGDDQTGSVIQYNLFKDMQSSADDTSGVSTLAHAIRVGQNAGVDANNESGLVIRHNRFDNVNNADRLIRVSASDVTIDRNTIVNSTGLIALEDGFGNTVSNNIVIPSGIADDDGAIRLNRFGHNIVNNYIAGINSDNANHGGIVLTNSDEIEGINDPVENAGNAALSVDNTTDFTVVIEHNTILNARQPFVFNDCLDTANFKSDFSSNLIASGENPTVDNDDNFGLEGRTIGESGSGFGAVVVNCNILSSDSTHNNERYYSDVLSIGAIGGFNFNTGSDNIGVDGTAGNADIVSGFGGLFEGSGSDATVGADTSNLIFIEESDVGPGSVTTYED